MHPSRLTIRCVFVRSPESPPGDGVQRGQSCDGKVDGDKISFKVSFNGMTISHEGSLTKSADGTVNADEIKLTSKADSGDFPGGEMTLTRAKVPASGSH